MVEGFPRVAFVLTDGQSNDVDATITTARLVHDAKLEVYAVGIGENTNEEELHAIATRAENVLNTKFDTALLKELQEFLEREACEGQYHTSAMHCQQKMQTYTLYDYTTIAKTKYLLNASNCQIFI